MTDNSIKEDVRHFYDQVGWQKISSGVYQNAEFEDLRPVSRAYIHKCHLRVNRHINHQGKYMLDAGSGPIQYPEYLTYSEGYQYRVCLDISIVALMDARERVGDHGLCVVADVANLPFAEGVMDGLVSLHTLHHLPEADYLPAYHELRRVLKSGARAVVVNGWGSSSMMNTFRRPILLMERLTRRNEVVLSGEKSSQSTEKVEKKAEKGKPEHTFAYKLDADGLRKMLGEDFPVQITVWRSVSVRFLRAMIQPWLLGRFWLAVLYGLEELFPRYYGEKGQYPLITFTKK
jgi:ubiquinone/menaquinone biosynthesis C-methylase UbiE